MTSRTDQLLFRIGRLNYVWSNTESLIIYVVAHLMGTSKEAAIVTFLTLNTTRARLDLIERLAKLPSTAPSDHDAVMNIVAKMKSAARLRNKFNHCIYSFDEHGELESTQLMKIADIGNHLKYGKVEPLDDGEMSRIDHTIAEILALNRAIWSFLHTHEIAA